MEDLSRICGGLLINIGTMRAENQEAMMMAGRYVFDGPLPDLIEFSLGTFANGFKKPVVFDPVGVGASAFRKANVKGQCFVVLFLNFSHELIRSSAEPMAGQCHQRKRWRTRCSCRNDRGKFHICRTTDKQRFMLGRLNQKALTVWDLGSKILSRL